MYREYSGAHGFAFFLLAVLPRVQSVVWICQVESMKKLFYLHHVPNVTKRCFSRRKCERVVVHTAVVCTILQVCCSHSMNCESVMFLSGE